MDSFATFLLTETLESPAPYRWITKRASLHAAAWSIGSEQYEVKFHNMGGSPLNSDWAVYFYQVVPLDGDASSYDDGTVDHRYGLTKTGHAFTVFATLVAIMKEFVSKTSPRRMFFTGNEESRIRVYRRLCRMASTIDPRYEWIPNPQQPEYFSINRKDTT